MRLGTRVWGIGKFLVLVGALGLTFLVFFGLAMRMTLRAREVEVPSLAGKTVNEATRIAAALGLGLRVDDNRARMRRFPPARSCSRIRAPASARGSSARSRLGQRGCARDHRADAHRPDRSHGPHPAGAGRHRPSCPSPKSARRTTRLTRSWRRTRRRRFARPACRCWSTAAKRPRPTSCPTSSAPRAYAPPPHCAPAVFRVTITGSQPYPGIPAGTVVRQTPAGGFRVGRGDPISLEVSR